MTIRTIAKELVRTPGKTLLFLLLLTLSTALLVLGVNLYLSCETARQEVSASYKTVGTVQQKPDSTLDIDEDYAERMMAVLPWSDPYAEYTISLPEDMFEGLPTKLPVEIRPSLITTADLYTQWDPEKAVPIETPFRLYPLDILTFVPQEDIDLEDENFFAGYDVRRAYSGVDFAFTAEVRSINGEELANPLVVSLYWPAEESENRMALKAGTEYISASSQAYTDNGTRGAYFLSRLYQTTEVTKTKMEYESASQVVYEHGPDFAEKEPQIAQWVENRLQSTQKLKEMSNHTVVTVPTQSLSLLDPFYQDKVTIRYGREITPEEFASGAKVCMLSEDYLYTGDDPENPDFVNFITPGDKVHLKWHGALYGSKPIDFSPTLFSMDTPQMGATYGVAGEEEYEVVGIFYTSMTGWDQETGGFTNLGSYTAIVPSASFDFDSIPALRGGPISQGACSFELENGSGGAFLQALENLENGNLIQVSLSDQGYSAIAKGLDAISLLATILLLSGSASALCLLLFFVYLQIARRQREAAIQLSLGAGKPRCAAFLLLSVLLVAFPGITAGAALGHSVTNSISTQVYSQAKEDGFSRDYSDQFEATSDKDFAYDGSAQWPRSLSAALAALTAAVALSSAFTFTALRKEPLEQLTRKE